MANDLTNKPFFDEESLRRAFEDPLWPAGTEIVVYCRHADNNEVIEAAAKWAGWKIDRYVYIDDLPIANIYKQGAVSFAKRESVDWKHEPTMLRHSDWRDHLPSIQEWQSMMLGGLRPQEWEKPERNNF